MPLMIKRNTRNIPYNRTPEAMEKKGWHTLFLLLQILLPRTSISLLVSALILGPGHGC